MDEYHFMADVLSTWRLMNDTTKNVFIIGGYATIIIGMLSWLLLRDWLRYRNALRRFVMDNHADLLRRDKNEGD